MSEWIIIHHDDWGGRTEKMRVDGGWLYRTGTWTRANGTSWALTFIPDAALPMQPSLFPRALPQAFTDWTDDELREQLTEVLCGRSRWDNMDAIQKEMNRRHRKAAGLPPKVVYGD